MTGETSTEQHSLPSEIRDFIVAFMRCLKTARLYASDHALFKQHSRHLFETVSRVTAAHDVLFLGFAKGALFLDGEFYRSTEVHLENFLQLFHLLGISHLLLDKDIHAEEVDCLLSFLAGARQGQGGDLVEALSRENIHRVKLGLLDYSVFGNVQSVTAQLAHTHADELIWRQLILYPAGVGILKLNSEQVRELQHICENVEELKKLVHEMDTNLSAAQQQGRGAPKGGLLANFIQNLAATLGRIAPGQRSTFARNVSAVLDSVEPGLKVQILGAAVPAAGGGAHDDVISEVFTALPDEELAHLLAGALEQEGAESPYFLNLLGRALRKYKDPALLLTIVRTEMHRSTPQGSSRRLERWHHLEQLVVRRQHAQELDEEYRREIEALNTSLFMQVPMVEEKEMEHLFQTMAPASLQIGRCQLVLDLVGQQHSPWGEALLGPLLQSLGPPLGEICGRKDFESLGALLRQAYLALAGHPQEAAAREVMESLLTAEQLRELLEGLLANCRSYGPNETASVNAVCQLFPEKAGAFLLDLLEQEKGEGTERTEWLLATLGGLGDRLTRPLSRKWHSAPDHALPQFLELVPLSGDQRLVPLVEKLLDHGAQHIRLHAVGVLGRLQASRAVPRLSEILAKKSWLKSKKEKELQLAAARALAQIRTEEAVSALQ
jgi:hypothetical protein